MTPRHRRWHRALAVVLPAVVAVGCTVPTGTSVQGPATPGVVDPAPASTLPPAPTGPQITVPGLPGAPAADPTPGMTASAPPATSASATASSATAPASPTVSAPATSAPAGTGPTSAPVPAEPEPFVGGQRAEIDLSGTCPECTVLSSRAQVVDQLAVAVVTMPGGRTAAMAVRPDGTSSSVLGIPYGVSFPTPPSGVLPCDSGGRCLVAATTPDGGVVTVLGLGPDGRLTDLSPPDGFVSVGAPARILDLDGEPGVAVLSVPGQTPTWSVFAWNGSTYGAVGCSTGPVPDLRSLDLDACG